MIDARQLIFQSLPLSNTSISGGDNAEVAMGKAQGQINANVTAIGNKADKATTITINGTTFDLSANRTWTISAGGSSTTLNDNLTTNSAGVAALDAHQGLVIKGLIDGNTTTIGGKLTASNNLSDLTSAPAARTNLGLGSIATKSSLIASDIPDISASYATQSQLSTANAAIAAKVSTTQSIVNALIFG